MVINDGDVFDDVLPFVRVADDLSFREAARRLGVTPAAVSRSVQRLEERLGVRLFERTTRSVRLTPEGERFAARCREALAQVRLARDEIARAKATPQGTLSVSASPILAKLVVPRLGRFLLRYPGLRVRLHLTDRVVRFADEDVDVALRVGDLEDASVVARAVLAPRWVTVASPAYLARRGTPRSVADLVGHDCVRFVTPRGRPSPWSFVDAETGATRALVPEGSLDVDLGDVLIDAALGDVGVIQVLDFMVDDHLRAGRLVEVLADHAAAGPKIHAVHPPSRRGLPRVKAFVGFLGEELGRRG